MRRLSFAFLALAALAGAQTHPFSARDRHEYDLIDVDWHVTVFPKNGAISGTVVNTLVALKDDPQLLFDCAKLDVASVAIGGKKAAFKTGGDVLTVGAKAKRGQTLKVRIEYRGMPEAGIYFVPAARAFPATGPVVYTQGEMEDNRYWLPTYDSPDDKATSRGRITVPAGWSVLSNGKQGPVRNSTWSWSMDKPHSTYLISFVAGPYTQIADGTDPVPVSIWAPKGLEAWGRNAFAGTDAIIRCYAKLTGTPYPWTKYAQSAVPDFMFGGMENVTATTQTLDALFPDSVRGTRDSTGLDAHELAHQWFGDYVTTPRWDDIWINEGWASFMPHFWAREKYGQEEYALERYDTLESAKGAMRGDPSRSMVWDGWKVPMDAFDGYAYPGGAARMFALMHKVGEPAFWAATKDYLAEYGGKNVDTAAFFRSYSKSLGMDLSGFERQWFRTPSVPPTVEVRRKGGKVSLHQTQATPFVLDLDVWALGADHRWIRKTVTMSGADLELDMGPGDRPVLVDPEVFLPIDVAYPDLTEKELIEMWGQAPNAAARLRLVNLLAPIIKEGGDKESLVETEPSPRLQARTMSFVTDPTTLLHLSRSPDEKLVQAALERMGRVARDPRTEARLAEVWQDRKANPDLRLAALDSLNRLKKDPLLVEEAWATDRFDDGYRTWALEQWASSAPDRAREAALAVLRGGSSEPVRLTAIRVLGRVKDKPGERVVFNALAAMMGERSNSPLRAAIGALADYGDKAAIPLLEKRKDHGLHFVRGDVADALRRLGS